MIIVLYYKMKILGISLSQFHDVEGFQIVQSIPEVTVLTKEQFNLCSGLILPRQQWCGRLLALQFKEDYFLVVKPMISKNQESDKTYKREKYIYSICLLVQKQDYLSSVKQQLYKETVSKIAKFLKILEQTNHIIYNHTQYKNYIAAILTNIFRDINEKGFCHLTYQCSYFTFINVNYAKDIQKKCIIKDYNVPVTLLDEKQIEQIESPLGRELMRYAFKGVFTFKKICKIHSDKQQIEIKQFYQIAVKKGLIFMLDMINVHNIYVLTQKIMEFVRQTEQSKEKLNHIANIISTGDKKIKVEQLMGLYLQFNRVGTLSKLIEVNRPLMAKIDVVKLIRMGQIFGFLVRNHQKIAYNYSPNPQPLILSEPLKKWLAERDSKLNIGQKFQEEMDNITQSMKKYLNANMIIDEIMVHLDIDYDRLLNMLNPQNRYILQINDE